jgi:mRNA interferase MazF
VLLLSRNEAYMVRELVIAAPVTTRMRHIPSEMPLGPEDGLPRQCVVNLDTVTTLDKRSLRERLTTLSSEKLKTVELALRFAAPAATAIANFPQFSNPHLPQFDFGKSLTIFLAFSLISPLSAITSLFPVRILENTF